MKPALTSNPTLAGGLSAALAPFLSWHGQPAATTLMKEIKKERRQYHGVHPKNPITCDVYGTEPH